MAKTKTADDTRTVNLALQGGGAHGALTWGVLDRVLEDDRIRIEGISGTSAGAINAAVLAEGHMKGGAAGARAELDRFWRRLSELGWLSPVHRGWYERATGTWNLDESPSSVWLDQLSHIVSPYQSNPLNLSPLRDLLPGIPPLRAPPAPHSLQPFITPTDRPDCHHRALTRSR